MLRREYEEKVFVSLGTDRRENWRGNVGNTERRNECGAMRMKCMRGGRNGSYDILTQSGTSLGLRSDHRGGPIDIAWHYTICIHGHIVWIYCLFF